MKEVYSCKYHVVGCPKYRRNVLDEKIAYRLKDILRAVALRDWSLEKNVIDLYKSSYFRPEFKDTKQAMTAIMTDKLRNFRSNLFACITFRADSTGDLIDAVAG